MRLSKWIASLCLLASTSLQAEPLTLASGELLRLPAKASDQQSLSVVLASGSTLLVPKHVTALHLQQLTMEAGSRLTIAPRPEAFELVIEQARFADGSIISGRGAKGRVGSDGGRGLDLQLTINALDIENLVIDISGGQGGSGWNGVPGEDGNQAGCFGWRSSGEGTSGGAGHQGARGGDGGNLTLRLGNSRALEVIDVIQSGGAGGDGGQGGLAGKGGVEKSCWLYSRDGATSGQSGLQGTAGQSGQQGVLRVN